MHLDNFKPNDIINKPSPPQYMPQYAVVIYDNEQYSSYFLSIILKAIVGLTKMDAQNKALEILREGSAVVKRGPLETAEVVASLLSNRAQLTVTIEKI